MIELEQQGYLGLYIDQRQARWQHRLGAAKRSGRIDSSQGRSLDTYVGLTRTPLSIHLSTYKIYNIRERPPTVSTIGYVIGHQCRSR